MALIGFDAQAVQGKQSGLGVFTRNLLASLKREIQKPLELRAYSNEVPSDCNVSTLSRLRWENFSLPRLVRKDRVDVLHVPAFAPAFRKPCRLIVTVHDIAGRLLKNQIGKLSSFYWGKWLPFVVRQADRIIVDSLHTKKDLLEHLRLEEAKIRVVYPSGHESFSADIPNEKILEIKKRLGIRDRYFLFVGTMEPRKNLGRILDAFKIFRDVHPEFQLVLAGSQSFAHGKYAGLLAERHSLSSDSVIAPGFLAHGELNALYGGATALLFPSLYEGFGIPILEAMASGCPVLTSRITSTPEVAGDAAVLVDPYSIEDLVQGVKTLAEDESLRAGLCAKGFQQLKKFSWQRTARETIEVYKELI